ncbi:MAG: SUMF1/EgtB/PvdO family nonheme iron enzyme [Pseudomonadota bacterium]
MSTDRIIFVAWDSELASVRETLGMLAEESGVPGVRVVLLGAVGAAPVGSLKQRLKDALGGAHGLLAFVDQPNANMAWELGQALGLGLRVALAHEGQAPQAWLEGTALEDMLAQPCGDDPERIRAVLRDFDHWHAPGERPAPGDGTALLCPEEGPAREYRKKLAADPCTQGWRPLGREGWNLPDLAVRLADCGRAVWVIPPKRAGEVRHGPGNAVWGLVAGYAEALGLTLGVFRHEQAHPIMDIAGRYRRYEGYDALLARLREWDSETSAAGADPRAPEGEAVLARWRDLTRREHERAVPLLGAASPVLLDDVHVALVLAPCAAAGARGLGRGPDRCDLDPACEADLRAAGPLDALVRDHLAAVDPAAPAGRWLVIGAPGGGKTTLARHLAWRLAGVEGPDPPVPVLLSLSALARAGVHPFVLAEDRLRARGPGLAPNALVRALERAAGQRGRLWLLLDGLDEVDPERLPALLGDLAAWCDDGVLRDAVVIVLGREVVRERAAVLGPAFRLARVQPLDLPRQQGLLAKLAAARVVAGEVADRLAEGLVKREYDTALVGNPLLLSLLALTAAARFEEGGEAPRERVKLLDQATTLLLTRGFRFGAQAEGGASKGMRDPRLARAVLRALSLRLHEAGGEQWSTEDLDEALWGLRKGRAETWRRYKEVWGKDNGPFLAELDKEGGILGHHDGESAPWRYLHRAFREFLAAEALAGRKERAGALQKGFRQGRGLEGQAQADHLERWGEVAALLCGLVGPEEARALLEGLVRDAPELAVRALRGVEGLEPWEHLGLLIGMEGDFEPPWDNDDLDAVVDLLGRRRPQATLWAAVGPGRSTFELGVLWYALERLAGAPPDPARFFAACGRDRERPSLPRVALAAGEFPMGSPEGVGEEDEHPRHMVTLTRPFSLGRTTVTRAQYRAFDPAHACPGWDDHPVTEVDWFAARLFAAWVGGRLPAEAEWEYACRAGTETAWSCGDGRAELGRHAWYGKNSRDEAYPVATRHPNPWGLYDMHGNVWEWTACRGYRRYSAEPVGDPVGPAAGPWREVRGGSFWDSAGGCRSACRNGRRPGDRSRALGFRVAWSPSRG